MGLYFKKEFKIDHKYCIFNLIEANLKKINI